MKKIIKCVCCKKEMEDMFNRKYCSNCSIYLGKLQRNVAYYKLRFNKLNKKMYGVENGSQRIRAKPSEVDDKDSLGVV